MWGGATVSVCSEVVGAGYGNVPACMGQARDSPGSQQPAGGSLHSVMMTKMELSKRNDV